MSIPSTGLNRVDSLLGGLSWTGNAGQSASLTWTFDVLLPQLVDQTYKQATTQALAAWSSVANVTFTYQEPSLFSNTSLIFSSDSTLESENIAGITYYTFVGSQLQNGVAIDLAPSMLGSSLQVGQEGFLTLLHEIGHGLGLKHSGQTGGDSPPFLPAAEDNNDATVMSYNYGTYASASNPAITPMIYDVAVAQYLYGVNRSYNSDNTIYNITGEQTAKTLWDGGGNDVITSGSYSGNVVLDLREGLEFFSRAGNSYVWNAFDAKIENATAGSGNDTVYGNFEANYILGNAGDDLLYGAIGVDTIYGNAGNDSMFSGRDNDQLFGGQGDDSLNGNIGNDSVSGDLGNDTLYGGQNEDTLNGGDGNDVLYGDKGNDLLIGAAGSDFYVFGVEAGGDTIQLFESPGILPGDLVQIKIQLATSVTQVLSAITYVSGNAVISLSGIAINILGIVPGALTAEDFSIIA